MDYTADIKLKLYEKCEEYIEEKIFNSKTALDNLKSTGEGDIKSSAGDKFETEIAMRHLELEKFGKQLSEALNLKKVMPLLKPEQRLTEVGVGSLVITSNGNFYIAISAGKIELDGKQYFALSGATPVAKLMEGKKAGDTFLLNNKTVEINEVF